MRPIAIELIISLTTAFVQFSLGAIITRPENTALLQHNQLILNCSSDISPNRQFVWHKITETDVIVVDLGDCIAQPTIDGYRYEWGATSCNLVVDNVNASHAGAFRCNVFGDSQASAAVNVIDQLSISAMNDSINATTRDSIVLECKVTYNGYMIPDLSWSTPSSIIQTSSDTKHASGESVSTLVITSQCEGSYDITCSVAFNASTLSFVDLNPPYMTSNITSQPFLVNFLSAVPTLHCEKCEVTVEIAIVIAFVCWAGGVLMTIGTVAILVKFEIMSWRPNAGI